MPAGSPGPTSSSKPPGGRYAPCEYPKPLQSTVPSTLLGRQPAGPRRGAPAHPQMLACSNEIPPFAQAAIGSSTLTSAKRASDLY